MEKKGKLNVQNHVLFLYDHKDEVQTFVTYLISFFFLEIKEICIGSTDLKLHIIV